MRYPNVTEDKSSQRQIAIRIAETALPDERTAILAWASDLLNIQASDRSKLSKARAGISVTLANKVVWPAVKIAARKTKQIGWDNRSRTARLGIGGAAIGMAVFGTQNAGIAALGTAVGVPLWVVSGAGVSFANVLIEEVTRRRREDDAKVSYSIINAERVDTAE